MTGRFGDRNQLTRDEWVRAKLLSLRPGLRILDVGAGQCPYKVDCSHLQYVSQDFAVYDGAGDAAGLQTGTWDSTRIDICGDILDLGEPDQSYDAVLCTEVIEHVPDPVAVVDALARLLKPGGRLLLTAPVSSLTHFSPYFYCTGFSRYFYEFHLGRLQFDPIEITANGDYFEYLAQELRRVPSVAKRFSKAAVRPFERMALAYVRHTLARLHSRQDGEPHSRELLCLGLHVDATKSG